MATELAPRVMPTSDSRVDSGAPMRAEATCTRATMASRLEVRTSSSARLGTGRSGAGQAPVVKGAKGGRGRQEPCWLRRLGRCPRTRGTRGADWQGQARAGASTGGGKRGSKASITGRVGCRHPGKGHDSPVCAGRAPGGSAWIKQGLQRVQAIARSLCRTAKRAQEGNWVIGKKGAKGCRALERWRPSAWRRLKRVDGSGGCGA